MNAYPMSISKIATASFRPLAELSALLLVCASCNGHKADDSRPDRAMPDPAAVEIRAVTEARTRVVWCQDIGDGSDTFAQGDQFQLVGYDTEDGMGERVILSEPANYSRPMLTPRGDRVVFSNRGEGKVYIVNWDGSGLRELGAGYAVSVWADPENGMEWVYVGTRVAKSDAVHTVRRFPVDRPEASELVWDKTPIDSNNVQLSADGRRSSGAFPWPACGIAELPNLGWKKYANGCWPSLAPDNSFLLWIFDGSHRNLTMFTPDGEERWVVNINGAPGIDRHEVYHPRWSNRARFMTMTGPYKIGAAANRIRGGGADVEIYVGRFADDFKTIERWVKVTHNSRADFYPDVWMPPDSTAGSVPAPKVETIQRVPPLPAWPGDTRGLVFLWENRSQNNEIRDAAGQPVRICRAEPSGLARYGKYFEMDLTGGVFVAESGADALLAECGNSRQLGLEAVLVPRQTDLRGFAGIISFLSGKNSFDFVLGQKNDRLVLRLHTGAVEEKGTAETDLCGLRAGMPHHVIASYGPGSLICFLNGERVLSATNVQADPGNWTAQSLVFGDTGGPGWSGTLEGIALYSRAIEDKEAGRKFALYAGQLKKRVPPPRLVIDARLKQASGIPTPESIVPYRRALVANQYDVVKVVEGQCSENQVLIAHWAILDGRVLNTAEREIDAVYRVVLEPYDDRPELEGERLIMDSDDFLLSMYYDIGG